MSLGYSKNGYTFTADVDTLTIEPGPQPVSLSRSELEQIGLAIRDDYRIEVNREEDEGPLIAGILATLAEALKRFEGQSNAWKRRHLRAAMVLIGGLDEKTAQETLHDSRRCADPHLFVPR